MSSREWTEVATGTEARSLRRWARRAVLPAVIRCVFGFFLLFVGLAAYMELYWAANPDPPSTYPPWADEGLFKPGIRPSRLIGDAIDNFFGEEEAPRIDPRFIDY